MQRSRPRLRTTAGLTLLAAWIVAVSPVPAWLRGANGPATNGARPSRVRRWHLRGRRGGKARRSVDPDDADAGGVVSIHSEVDVLSRRHDRTASRVLGGDESVHATAPQP